MARNLLVATFLACLAFTLASPAIDVRIAGGIDAFPNQFPYQVAIYAFVEEQHVPLQDDFCSGSLISPNYVLTAASCLVNAQYVTIVAGSQQLEELESGAVKVVSSEFIIPDNYVDGKQEWNLALIKLCQPLELTDNIQTVALAEGDDDYAGDVASVAGWGATYAAQLTVEPTLKWFESVILSYRQCVKNNSFYKDIIVKGANICQYTESSYKSACRGDAGAPLTNDGVQIGLVASPPANCFRGYPVIFTRVANYIDWIKDNSDL